MLRTTLTLDEGIIDRIEELAERHGKIKSEITRAFMKAGSRVMEKGGIGGRGIPLRINRPLVKFEFKNRKGENKELGIRFRDLQGKIEDLNSNESISKTGSDLLILGLIAHDPSSFELTGLVGGPRSFTEADVPEVDAKRLIREG